MPAVHQINQLDWTWSMWDLVRRAGRVSLGNSKKQAWNSEPIYVPHFHSHGEALHGTDDLCLPKED